MRMRIGAANSGATLLLTAWIKQILFKSDESGYLDSGISTLWEKNHQGTKSTNGKNCPRGVGLARRAGWGKRSVFCHSLFLTCLAVNMFLLDRVVHGGQQFTFPLLSFTLPFAWPSQLLLLFSGSVPLVPPPGALSSPH